jgi:hypothetical protein
LNLELAATSGSKRTGGLDSVIRRLSEEKV